MKLVIDILEEEFNECKMQVDMIKQEGFLIESLNTALKIHVANGQLIPEGAEILTKEAYSDLCIRASIANENGWVTDRVPTEQEVEEAGDVGFILCVSGKDKNWNYDHAIILGSNYFEGGQWFMESVQKPERIIVHGWMLPPSWKEGGCL